MKNNFPNRLIYEMSPYLQQHAYNPVDWHPWNEEALLKAQSENKLLIISIGYAACHWCHVMERECFEDKDIAAIMNEYFVPVKVDREERPDIDQVYMNSAYLTTGRGGWPLNAIALPDGSPVFAGTYFPREQWARILYHFAGLWQKQPDELKDAAIRIKSGIREIIFEGYKPENSAFIGFPDLKSFAEVLLHSVDMVKGGLDKSPKFPMPSVFNFLLQWYYHTGDERALNAVKITLDSMMNGGIFDWVGGGFARYSTDEDWFVPHFEKMLYDNAQLISLYSNAYKLTGNSKYSDVVKKTIQWVKNEMKSEDGLFYSSLDADSDGEEGKFYTWTSDELKIILKDDFHWFKILFGIEENGNWDGTNILTLNSKDYSVVSEFFKNEETFKIKLEECRQILFNERMKRNRPGLDDKILVSWNSLMIKGLVDAYAALGVKDYLDDAEKAVQFLLKFNSSDEGGLYRCYKDGVASVHAFMDDYSMLISALISLYQATFDEKYLFKAKVLTEYTLDKFFDSELGVFYFTSSKSDSLIYRTIEISDNVMPASNSLMAENLKLLSYYFENETWNNLSLKLCQNILENAKKQATYHSYWGIVFLMHNFSLYEVTIVGEYEKEKILNKYSPDILLSGTQNSSDLNFIKEKSKKRGIYICKDKVCSAPIDSLDKFWGQLEEIKGVKG